VASRGAGAGVAAAAWFATAGVLGLLIALGRPAIDGLDSWIVRWIVSCLCLLVAVRIGLGLLMQRWRKADRLFRMVAVVGRGPLAERVLRRLHAERRGEIRVAGIYDDGHGSDGFGHLVSGNINDLVQDIALRRIDEVVLAIPSADLHRSASTLLKLGAASIAVHRIIEPITFWSAPCRAQPAAKSDLVRVLEAPLRDWRGVGKAIEDRVLAALMLIPLAPVMLLIAALIKCTSPGPVLFRQVRHGLNNRLIEVLKFRTMYENKCDANAEKLTQRDDPRVTPLGAFLRATMLDELPQLINVLRGEMSIVGPRPHALRAKAGGLLYRDAVPYYDVRHRMKPGITGWAQVNGWHGTTDTVEQIEKRVEYDLQYIENWSVDLDLAIILRTLLMPLKRLRRT
jgi:Undecaprenyl-phosphate glucose phosphotransferase